MKFLNFALGLRSVPSKHPRPLCPGLVPAPRPSPTPQCSPQVRHHNTMSFKGDKTEFAIQVLTPSPLRPRVPGRVQGLCFQPCGVHGGHRHVGDAGTGATLLKLFSSRRQSPSQPTPHLCTKTKRRPFLKTTAVSWKTVVISPQIHKVQEVSSTSWAVVLWSGARPCSHPQASSLKPSPSSLSTNCRIGCVTHMTHMDMQLCSFQSPSHPCAH